LKDYLDNIRDNFEMRMRYFSMQERDVRLPNSLLSKYFKTVEVVDILHSLGFLNEEIFFEQFVK